MNTREGRAWRALAAAKGLGPKALWRIAAYLESKERAASWLVEHPEKMGEALGVSRAGFAIPDLVLHEHDRIGRFPGREVTLLHPLHPDFPQRLRALEENLPLPALLYVRGNIALLERPGAAIVGKRQPGEAALAAAAALAAGLVARGINIVSGYAPGIDSAAHGAALRAGGTTTAVLPEGLYHFQARPEMQDYLTVDNILVISQFDPDARWAAYQAMARNKLVAALSGALVVIVSGSERDASGRHSGTFDAAMSARRLGLPVFAVDPSFFPEPPPGNRDLIARGCMPWDPSSGAAPILEAIQAAEKNKSGQQNLF
jgi:DNA protecting protein DprA